MEFLETKFWVDINEKLFPIINQNSISHSIVTSYLAVLYTLVVVIDISFELVPEISSLSNNVEAS